MSYFKHYDGLYLSAKLRLARLRKKAQEMNELRAKHNLEGTYTWRDVRYTKWNDEYAGKGRWSDDREEFYCENFEGFREIGRADEVAKSEGCWRSIDHTGWYTDHWQSDTMAGYVLQLPSRGGVPVYVPATKHSEWDGVTIYPKHRYDDKMECARAADSYAEEAAEKERDYQAKEQANHDIEQAHTEMKENIFTAGELLSELKQAKASNLCKALPTIMRQVAADLRKFREENHRLLKRIKELRDNYWKAVEGFY